MASMACYPATSCAPPPDGATARTLQGPKPLSALESCHRRDYPFGHLLQRLQRTGVDESAMRDLDAQFGQFVKMFDRLLDPITVRAQVKPRLNGLFDLAVVPTLPVTVLPKHIQLVGELRAVEDVAGVGISGHQPQRLTLPCTADQDRRIRAAPRLRVPLHDGSAHREQLAPFGLAGQMPERGVGLEHLVFRRPKVADLPYVIHHADPIEAGLLGEECYVRH